jgi:hypothetical protein
MKLNPSMPLPKKVNICGMWYPVVLVPDLRDTDETKLDGNINYSPCKISIERKLSDQNRWHTFIHEVVHGTMTSAKIEWAEGEEKRVDAMASQLYCTLFNTEWQK